MGTYGSKQRKSQKGPLHPPQVVITASDRVRLELKLQRDKLIAAVRKYEYAAKEEREKAGVFLQSGNRRKALYCLKRERAQRSQVTSIMDMLDNVQRLLDTVEFSQIELEVVNALQNGKDELSRLNAMLDVSDITQLMDDVAETVEEARRIDDVLAQPLHGYDEEALINELLAQENPAVGEMESGLKDVVVPSQKLPEQPVPDVPVVDSKLEGLLLPA